MIAVIHLQLPGLLKIARWDFLRHVWLLRFAQRSIRRKLATPPTCPGSSSLHDRLRFGVLLKIRQRNKYVKTTNCFWTIKISNKLC